MVGSKRMLDEVQSNTIFEARWPIDQMFVDERPGGYARPLNERRVKSLTADWDEQSIGVLLLSMRSDGKAAIIDGRHRAHVAKLKGRKSLPSYVYIDLTLDEEARLYRRFGETLSQSARDRYLAALVEGNETALAIEAILRAHRLHVPSTGGQVSYGVQAVQALQVVMKQQGPDVLDLTLTLISDAYGGDPQAYAGQIIIGAALFVDRYCGSAVFNRRYSWFTSKLEAVSVAGLNGKANSFKLTGSKPGNAYGQALLLLFNAGRGEKLPEWQERKYKPEVKAKMTKRLRERADPAKRAKRRAA